MDTFKVARLSQNRQTEYHIEHTARKKDNEYRVRRGTYGTWTRWFPTPNMDKRLTELGFIPEPTTLLHDFFMESHFGRGTIRLNQDMALDIAKDSSVSEIGGHVYSRMKQISAEEFAIPASAITNQQVFWYVHRIIKNNL
jgi:hypothetical protein